MAGDDGCWVGWGQEVFVGLGDDDGVGFSPACWLVADSPKGGVEGVEEVWDGVIGRLDA